MANYEVTGAAESAWALYERPTIHILAYDSARISRITPKQKNHAYCFVSTLVLWKGFPWMSMPDSVSVIVFPSLLHSM
jgi:hypothetical protein